MELRFSVRGGAGFECQFGLARAECCLLIVMRPTTQMQDTVLNPGTEVGGRLVADLGLMGGSLSVGARKAAPCNVVVRAQVDEDGCSHMAVEVDCVSVFEKRTRTMDTGGDMHVTIHQYRGARSANDTLCIDRGHAGITALCVG